MAAGKLHVIACKAGGLVPLLWILREGLRSPAAADLHQLE